MSVYYPAPTNAYSLFSVQVLSPSPIPSTPPAPLYAAWCVDANTHIDVAQQGNFSFYSGYLYSSCDPDLNVKLGQGDPGVSHPASCYVAPAVWQKINYLINHRDFTKPPYNLPAGIEGYTFAFYWDVEEAINSLVGGPRTNHYFTVHQQVVAALLSAAAANAAGWTPQSGVDKMAAIAYLDPTPFALPGDELQLIILEVPCPAAPLPPLVTLIGSSNVVVECHTAYAELGATAIDAAAGTNLAVVISGSVNANVAGTYTLLYSAADASGNSNGVTRTVRVVDTTPPTVRLIGASYVAVPVHTPYTELGATATDFGVGTNLSVFISGSVNTNMPGTYTLLYSAIDEVGNSNGVARSVQVVDTQNSTPACPLVLPDYPSNALSVQMTAYYPGPWTASSLFSAEVLSPAPITASPPMYAGWCADANTFINVAQQGNFSFFSGYLYSSCDPSLNTKLGQGDPGVGHPASCYVSPATWQKVNYLLNHRDFTKPPYNLAGGIQGYTFAFYWDVQEAINAFVGGPRTEHLFAVHQDVVAALTNAANANGGGWTPQGGVDKIAAVAYLDATPFAVPGDDPQLIILEVPLPAVTLTPPVVTLNGPSNLVVECHTAYAELGATAIDSVTGTNLPVVIWGSVNTNLLGTYTLIYSAADAHGGSNGVVRTVRVEDTQAPLIGGISATQNQFGVGIVNLLNCAASFVPAVINISVQANDACGLAGPPAVVLNNGTNLGNAAFIAENPSGTYAYTWMGPTNVAGTWTATVTAIDGMSNVATAQFSLCRFIVAGLVELESFAGTNRTVVFVATGGATGTNLLQTNSVVLTFLTNGAPRRVKYAAYEITVPVTTSNLSAKADWNLRRRSATTFNSGKALLNFAGNSKLLGGDIGGIGGPDNRINLNDYTMLLLKWGNLASGWIAADITGDGKVNLADYTILLLNWGKEGNPP